MLQAYNSTNAAQYLVVFILRSIIVTSLCVCFLSDCDVNLPNSEGDTPLWVACTKGNEEIVRILMRHPTIELDRGVTHVPLHAAAVLGHCAIAELLINAGTNVNKVRR